MQNTVEGLNFRLNQFIYLFFSENLLFGGIGFFYRVSVESESDERDLEPLSVAVRLHQFTQRRVLKNKNDQINKKKILRKF